VREEAADRQPPQKCSTLTTNHWAPGRPPCSPWTLEAGPVGPAVGWGCRTGARTHPTASVAAVAASRSTGWRDQTLSQHLERQTPMLPCADPGDCRDRCLQCSARLARYAAVRKPDPVAAPQAQVRKARGAAWRGASPLSPLDRAQHISFKTTAAASGPFRSAATRGVILCVTSLVPRAFPERAAFITSQRTRGWPPSRRGRQGPPAPRGRHAAVLGARWRVKRRPGPSGGRGGGLVRRAPMLRSGPPTLQPRCDVLGSPGQARKHTVTLSRQPHDIQSLESVK
jgi:hypothetical protein